MASLVTCMGHMAFLLEKKNLCASCTSRAADTRNQHIYVSQFRVSVGRLISTPQHESSYF